MAHPVPGLRIRNFDTPRFYCSFPRENTPSDWELMRCGPSVGANAEEAQDGQTKADFIAKLAISQKESGESRYWLRVAIRLKKVTKEETAWELNEAGELRAMIVAAIKTAQASSTRGQPNHKP